MNFGCLVTDITDLQKIYIVGDLYSEFRLKYWMKLIVSFKASKYGQKYERSVQETSNPKNLVNHKKGKISMFIILNNLSAIFFS